MVCIPEAGLDLKILPIRIHVFKAPKPKIKSFTFIDNKLSILLIFLQKYFNELIIDRSNCGSEWSFIAGLLESWGCWSFAKHWIHCCSLFREVSTRSKIRAITASNCRQWTAITATEFSVDYESRYFSNHCSKFL